MNSPYKIESIIPIDLQLIYEFFNDEIIEKFVDEGKLLLKDGNEIILKKSIEKNRYYVVFNLYFKIIVNEGEKTNSVSFNYQPYLNFFIEINSEIRNYRTKSLIYPYQGAIESDIFNSPQFKKTMHTASNPKDRQFQGKKKPFLLSQQFNNINGDIKNSSNSYIQFESKIIKKLMEDKWIESYQSDRKNTYIIWNKCKNINFINFKQRIIDEYDISKKDLFLLDEFIKYHNIVD